LKIHFLEDLMRKSDPNLNQAALKENTDLRVDRATLTRDLSKMKKQLAAAAQDAESLRKQLLDSKARGERNEAEKHLQEELIMLRESVSSKEEEIEKLQSVLDSESKTQEVQNLKDNIEDLEAELREKERVIDTFNEKADRDASYLDRLHDLEEELEEANQKIEELQNSNKAAKELQDAVHRAGKDAELAEKARKLAEQERDELAQELDRETEQAESQYQALRQKYDALKSKFQTSTETIEDLENALKKSQADAQARERNHLREIEAIRKQHEEVLKSRGPVEDRVQDLLRQLQAMTDEKDLLQTRHDGLTKESEELQRDLVQSRSDNVRLQKEIDYERQQSLDNERSQRQDANLAQEKVTLENNRLRRALESERAKNTNIEETWTAKYKELNSQKDVLEKRANGLQQSIDKLQQTEGAISSKESQLQNALESEKEHHKSEERLLNKQIHDLQTDVAEKRNTINQYRTEIATLKEDIRTHARNTEKSSEREQALEDEIVVLQSAIDEATEHANQEATRLRKQIDTQRSQISANKQEISRLQSELSAAEMQARALMDNTKVEVTNEQQSQLRNQLESALKQAKDLRARILDLESKARSEALVLDKASNQRDEKLQQLQDQLEQKAYDLELEKAEKEKIREGVEKTTQRLRTRVQDLEKELRTARLANAEEKTIAIERKDLHEMLKSAKLEAEDLRFQLMDRQAHADSAREREKTLQSQLQRVRSERSQHQKRASELVRDLKHLRSLYDSTVEELEKKANAIDPEDFNAKDKQHSAELRGLAKQIGFLKARCQREQAFRESLTYEKKFLLMQVDMFKAW
jgi:chromosome segregation ATPase